MRSSKSTLIGIACLLAISVAIGSSCAKKPAEPAPVQPEVQVETPKPIISSLTAAGQVPALGSTQVVCTANEADTDNLTYNWGATGGTISGAGSAVTWTAPEKTGDYLITVVVSDGKGGAAKKDVIINVPEKPNNPPVIQAVKFTRPQHQPVIVKTNMTDAEKAKLPDLVIRKYETADISCMASDPDNDKLTYIWQATGGKLIGNGANMQWIAAGEPGIYTISVEVSDDKGAEATFQITVNVHCCSG